MTVLGDTLLCVMHTKSNSFFFNLNEARGILFCLCYEQLCDLLLNWERLGRNLTFELLMEYNSCIFVLVTTPI